MKSSDTIFRKLSFMKRYVDYLKSLDPETLDPETLDLEYDYEKRSAVERNFQLAIESAIAIGEIIISEEGFERPADYKSVFLVLGKHSILRKVLQKNSHLLPDLGMCLSTCMMKWIWKF
jgi:uncharacterized protein YutE (UPF0331/DUF86 family)